MPKAIDIPLAKFRPTSKAPFNPAPYVTAIPSMLLIEILAFSIALSKTDII